jgi:hypothetical protein
MKFALKKQTRHAACCCMVVLLRRDPEREYDPRAFNFAPGRLLESILLIICRRDYDELLNEINQKRSDANQIKGAHSLGRGHSLEKIYLYTSLYSDLVHTYILLHDLRPIICIL